MSTDQPAPQKSRKGIYIAVIAVVVIVVAIIGLVIAPMLLNPAKPMVMISKGTVYQINGTDYAAAGPFKIGNSKITGAMNVTGQNYGVFGNDNLIWFYIFNSFQYSAFTATFSNQTAANNYPYIFYQNTYSDGDVVITNLSAGTYYLVFDNVMGGVENVSVAIQFLATPN